MKKIILDYSDGPNTITRVLKLGQESQKGHNQKDGCKRKRPDGPPLALEKKKGHMIKDCGQPLEAGKQENGFSSRASRKEDSPDNTVHLVH